MDRVTASFGILITARAAQCIVSIIAALYFGAVTCTLMHWTCRLQLRESKPWRCTSSAATRAVATGGGTEKDPGRIWGISCRRITIRTRKLSSRLAGLGMNLHRDWNGAAVKKTWVQTCRLDACLPAWFTMLLGNVVNKIRCNLVS